MARSRAPVGRSPEYAWLITAPLMLFAVLLTIPVVLQDPHPGRNLYATPIFFLLFTLTNLAPLRFDVRRQGFTISLNDVPLLLALYYLSPIQVLLVRVLAGVASQLVSRNTFVKLSFNVAGWMAGTACANVVVAVFGLHGLGPQTWLVLGAAVVINALVTLASVGGVIVLVQGPAFLTQFLRSAGPTFVAVLVNITIALVMLLTLQANRWSSLVLVALAIILGVVYRAYAQFLRQHKSLTEMYALTRAIGATNNDGTLPDVLLSRVRALMQADSATLWVPAQGRHAEMLLSSRIDYPGLLDTIPTPEILRLRAVELGDTVAAGPKDGPEDLRAALHDAGVKDAIVVPLRSGSVVIGTLEVADRLGDATHFGDDDVRLLETLSAHAGVAVENSRLVDRLRYDANHDALTGLANRRRMLEALDEAIKGRAPGEVVAVLLFDVVGLRQVNGFLGHAAGDKVLAEVAARLRDLAPRGSLIARVGGDEFVVELRTVDAEAAVTAADSLRNGLRDRMVIEALTVDVDANVGVAVYPDHGHEPEILLQRADVATHAAKRRGVVQLFNPGLESRSVRRLGLAGDLRVALRAGELEVHFQPKVALRDRRLVGVECLARWDHPVHGSVPPEDFVSVAEHTGQLPVLNEIVLREGLRRAREWAQAGRALSVSVNVSLRMLAEAGFPAQVAALLDEYHVPAERLTLEIPEVELVGSERSLPVLHHLRDLGVRLSIDDFGNGQSSLATLSGLPVHEIKIDRTFVQGMVTDTGDLAIVRTIVDMGRHFGVAVVAEGVESERTLGLLEEVGCDIGQGFLFSRALPHERFEAWLQIQADADPAAAPEGQVRWLRAVP